MNSSTETLSINYNSRLINESTYPGLAIVIGKPLGNIACRLMPLNFPLNIFMNLCPVSSRQSTPTLNFKLLILISEFLIQISLVENIGVEPMTSTVQA